MESQRLRHDLATKQQEQQQITTTKIAIPYHPPKKETSTATMENSVEIP